MRIGALLAVVLWGTCWHKSFGRSLQSYHRAYRLEDCAASGQKPNREEAQPQPSTDNWIQVWLSMALPTRARPSFPHSQSLPSGSLHKPYSQPSENRKKNQEVQSYNIQNKNHKHRKLTKVITCITAFCNSKKLWATPYMVTCKWSMVESSDKKWPTVKGNGKPLQYPCVKNPMNSMTRQKAMTPEDECPSPRVVGVQYATGKEWIDGSRKNEEALSKLKWCLAVNVSAGESKVWCC